MSDLFSDLVKSGLKSLDQLDSVERNKILRNTPKIALQEYPSPAPRPDQQKDNAPSRTAEYAVLTLLTISSKHNFDVNKLRLVLEDLGLTDAIIAELTDNYKQHKDDIQKNLAKHGSYLPCLKNINWQLASKLKSSGNDNLSGELVCKIALEGTNPNGDRNVITTFECTIEELQNLIGNFKEIERQCFKFAENKS